MAAQPGLTIGGVRVATPQHGPDPDTVFKELGMSFSIHEKTVYHMTTKLGLKTLNDFFYLFAGPEDVESVLVSKVPDIANVALETSRVRQAWIGVRDAVRESEAAKSKGTESTDMDAVLSKPELDTLYDTFWLRYKIEFSADVTPSDLLVSRRYKEIARRLLTVGDPMRARTLAHQLQAQRKRQCIPGTKLTITEEFDEAMEAADSVANYLRGILTDLIALAKAGCLQRSGAPSAEPRGSRTTDFVEVPLDVVLKYHRRAERSAAAVVQQSAVQWLRKRHEQEVSLWVERHRQSQLSLGEIILQTYTEREAVWMPPEAARSVVASAELEPMYVGNQTSGALVGSPTKKRRSQGQAAPESPNKTLATTKDGRKICAAWNQGKCRQPCPRNEEHICSRALKGGRACAMRNHTAAQCMAKRKQ